MLNSIWELAKTKGLDHLIYSGSNYSDAVREEAVIFREKKEPFIQETVAAAIGDAKMREELWAFHHILRSVIIRQDALLPEQLTTWLKNVLYEEPLY